MLGEVEFDEQVDISRDDRLTIYQKVEESKAENSGKQVTLEDF
jgi:hypothetical protein